ncbi:MAG: SMI1/KNR4 family protein [Paludibacter sp.]|nr:SMI1/KNR4 family protein [Paludibacter sp.]
MELKTFKDLDFSDFWDDTEYSLKNYVENEPTDEQISLIEKELGFKLPASYIELMKLHNGGKPKNCCYPTTERTSWADDHVALTVIMGIGRTKSYSLCGSVGSQFMIDEWGYPETGVLICNCPSAGHDMIMLDYSKCGKDGEPEVVHIDQECDYKKTFLAKDFETFIRGLVSSDMYDISEQDLLSPS